MPDCKKCGEYFPTRIKLNGASKNLNGRKHCLSCVPFGTRPRSGKPRLYKRKFICKTCSKEVNQTTRNNECSSCKSRKRRAKHKQMALEILGGKCVKCGYNECEKALDFHHIDESTKSFTISTNWQISWEKIEKELKKCEILCCRCHRELHATSG